MSLPTPGGPRVVLPGGHRCAPATAARPADEPVDGHDRAAVGVACDRLHLIGAAPLVGAARSRPVDEDGEDPRSHTGATLEGGDAADDGEPRLLDDLLGRRSVGHERPRDAQHRRVVALDEGTEGDGVALAQKRDETRLVVGPDVGVVARAVPHAPSLAKVRPSPHAGGVPTSVSGGGARRTGCA